MNEYEPQTQHLSRDGRFSSLDTGRGTPGLSTYLTDRSCPICGAKDQRSVIRLEGVQFFSDPKDQPKQTDVQTVYCGQCFAVYMNPVYSELGFKILFEEAGHSYGSSLGRMQEQVEWMRSHDLLKTGAVLDIGCNIGNFLSALPNNLERTGVDIDPATVKRAQSIPENKDIAFYHSNFEKLELGRQFDCLTMFHVLEHFRDPMMVLKELHHVAYETTKLVVEIPTLEGGMKHEDINSFFTPHHLTHFSIASARNAFRVAGWHVDQEYICEDYNAVRFLLVQGTEASEVEPGYRDLKKLWETTAYIYKIYARMEQRISRIPKNVPIVIWGAGLHTELLYHKTTLFSEPDRSFILIDGDTAKQGLRWRGVEIHPPSILRELTAQPLLKVIISAFGAQLSIIADCTKLGVPINSIVTLYDDVNGY